MSRPKLGSFIRSINYLAAKEERNEEEEDPGNQLIDLERQCNQDDNFSFSELLDGYAAFREKVCIPEFTGRHSPPYWIAYSTVCVLERLTRDFEDDEDKQMKIGHEQLYTWLALFCARPSSGHLDLMSKFTGDLFSKYITACKPDELTSVMQRMKVQFSYDSANETDEEQTYASFLNDRLDDFFKCLSEEQCLEPTVQKTVLDLRMYYQKQISKLSPTMATYIGYLVRDMVSMFPDKSPYQNFTQGEDIRSHIAIIEESLCTFEGDLKSLRDEDTLKEIISNSRTSPMIKVVFPDLMGLIIRFSKRRVPLQNGKRIYDVYRIHLFRDIHKFVQPDNDMFDSCVAMVTSILTDGGELEKAKQDMIAEAMSECVLKLKDLTPSRVKALLDLLITMINSGRTKLVRTVKNTLELKHYKKVFDWKKFVDEAKKFLVAVATLPCERMERSDHRDYDEVIRELRDTTKTLMEMLKKAKINNQIQKDHVSFIFDCMEIAKPLKDELASEASESNFLVLSCSDADLVDEILIRVDKMLKDPDIQWNNDNAIAVQNLLGAVIESYNGNGKNVSDAQHSKFLSIFATCCEGETLEDKMLSEEEHLVTVYYRIYLAVLIPYIALHAQSKTLSRCVPICKDVLKWWKIALHEDHDDLQTVSFGALQFVSQDLPPELADIVPEVVELFLSAEDVSYMTIILRSLYALNPDSVENKLVSFLEKVEDVSQSGKVSIASILSEVATKHPQKFTEQHIGKLMDLAAGEDQEVQVMLFNILSQIAAQYPQGLCSQFSKLQDDGSYHSSTLVLRLMAIVRIACFDMKFSGGAIEYTIKHLKKSDQSTRQKVLSQMILLARNDRDGITKYKEDIEEIEKSSNSQEVKEYCRNIIDIIDGKNIEGVLEDIQQAQEDISGLDKKVDATMTTVISVGERVIEQDKDISKVKSDLDHLDERVDVVEEDLSDTKVKVEDIDNKTMTNAPKWSRDLTKLLNPVDDNDWRLLAKRLGYSNDDIRSWAQQNDSCMALLSEWYATNKTSEATYGLLTHLQEMNRQDGVVIVENAMKAAEDVVEDEEFEYAKPPPVFLSYQWGIQNEVKLLKQHLNMAGYECWMDIGQMGGGDKLFNKIDTGIRAAKVVICCTTERYAQSPNCNREVNLSVNLGKPIIPLLMEKMAWPPKGSMGPIFSEYLFIRFFQRDGEETRDQRFWPTAKFQELLMQINFHAVPDQALIQPVYSNWWTPIVEEIEIKDRSKADNSKKADSNPVTSKPGVDLSPSIFLSYQWGKQPQVKALYERLLSLGYTVWMDIFQMGGGDSLFDKIDRGMRGCKVVISCVTTKYALSANCRREVSLADALKKPIIPLLLESMKWPPDGPMSMIFTELLYINVYRDQEVQDSWTGTKFEELKEKLQQYAPDALQSEQKGNAKKSTSSDVKSAVVIKAHAVQRDAPKPEVEAQPISSQSADKFQNGEAKGKKKSDVNTEDVPERKIKEKSSDDTNDKKSSMTSDSQEKKSKSCIII